jgi:alpha-L-fucosidase 2
VAVNFGPNLFSLFDPSSSDPIFQIDANLGYPAAVLVGEVALLFFVAPLMLCIMRYQQNALLQSPDVPTLSTPLIVTLLPALPLQWSSGSIRGARIRGAMSVDLQWSGGKPTEVVFNVDANAQSRDVRVMYADNIVAEFVTTSGLMQSLSFA